MGAVSPVHCQHVFFASITKSPGILSKLMFKTRKEQSKLQDNKVIKPVCGKYSGIQQSLFHCASNKNRVVSPSAKQDGAVRFPMLNYWQNNRHNHLSLFPHLGELFTLLLPNPGEMDMSRTKLTLKAINPTNTNYCNGSTSS